MAVSAHAQRPHRGTVPIQGLAPQGCLPGGRVVLADSEARTGSGWRQSKQNSSANSVEGQSARVSSTGPQAVPPPTRLPLIFRFTRALQGTRPVQCARSVPYPRACSARVSQAHTHCQSYLGSHPLKFDRYSENYHGTCARMMTRLTRETNFFLIQYGPAFCLFPDPRLRKPHIGPLCASTPPQRRLALTERVRNESPAE